jgi:hypothetical protein
MFKRTFALPSSLSDWVPFIALLARLLSPATADLSFLILAVYALRGRPQAIQALALSWLFIMLNSALAPQATYAEMGRYMVILGAALSIVWRKASMTSRIDGRFMALTIILGMFFVVHALVFSAMPDVSILKAVSWMVTMTTLISAWRGVTSEQSALLQSWLTGFLIIILLISLPFVAIPSIGYLRNGSGFQGILSHPQAFGPVMALLGALLLGWLLTQKRPPWKAIALVLVCLGLIVMSEARTAGIALVFGVGFALFSVSFLSGKSLPKLAPALRSQRFQVLILFGFFVALALGSQLGAVANQFITKGGRAQVSGLVEAYDDSRGFKVDEMLENIGAQPFSGIGFGIASDPDAMNVTRDPFLGLPMGASVEKGVMPLAVLEEVGVPGFILVGIWIFSLLHRAAVRGVATLSVTMVILFINMGESVLFSPGGMGMLSLILLAWATATPMEQPA